MRRIEPAIGRQVEHQHAARLEAAAEFAERRALVDAAMAQHVGAEDGIERTGRRRAARRSCRRRPARRSSARATRHAPASSSTPKRRASGAAAPSRARNPPVPQPASSTHAARARARRRARQAAIRLRVQAAEPPHPLLDRGQALIFAALQRRRSTCPPASARSSAPGCRAGRCTSDNSVPMRSTR